MNRIEIEIGGKLRTFIFGLGFLGEILDYLDTNVEGLGKMMDRNPFKVIPAILYFGHKSELEITGRPVDFTFNDACTWVEEMENSYAHPDIEKVLKHMISSMRKNVPGLDEVYTHMEKEESKKK
ncbi:MAG TPA: hypothetical protein VMW91_10810 [Desulfosporosinus sp.]|nr:hypothetical protein [Desulfosporosinus sp.]